MQETHIFQYKKKGVKARDVAIYPTTKISDNEGPFSVPSNS